MEDNLNIFENGKWKKTSIFWKMEDDVNFLVGKAPSCPEFGTTQP